MLRHGGNQKLGTRTKHNSERVVKRARRKSNLKGHKKSE